jgi:hypothetical protein
MTTEDALRLIAWPLLGAASGAVVTSFYNLQLARMKATVDLHAEFHSESFLKARIATDAALTKYIVDQRLNTLSALHRACTPEEWASVSRVIHFFERLVAMRSSGLVHKKSANRLLGSYSAYFASQYFSRLSEEPNEWLPLVKALRGLNAA